MINFCKECGAKIEQSFKFCPTCGSEIIHSSSSPEKNTDQNSLIVEDRIICSNCGEENSVENDLCNSCGVKLGQSPNAKVQTKTADKKKVPLKIETGKTRKQSKPNKKVINEAQTASEKKLEPKKIAAYVGSVILVIFAILLFSGVFDSPKNISTQTVDNQQSQSSGIDLNEISKINELKDFVEKNPNDESAILELANLRFDSGFFQDAAANYDQYLKLNPNNADARIDMAVCYYNLRQFDKAESEIMAALKIEPKHQTAFLNLGVIYLAKQNIEKAKEQFKKAVELDANSEIGKKAQSLLESH